MQKQLFSWNQLVLKFLKPPAQAAPAATAEKAPLVDNEHDIIVVGGGPAGYYSAIRGAQLAVGCYR